MGESAPQMEPGPPEMMERVAGVLIPPACREEVTGDLHERYTTPSQYAREALRTVPLVILSRIRRTTNPALLLLEALALYLAMVTAARVIVGLEFLSAQQGYLRLAIPVLMALVVLMLVDAYASLHRRLVWGPVVGLCAILAQWQLLSTNSELGLPSFRMTLLGSLAGMLLVGALRFLFAPHDHRTTGAG